MNPISLIFAIGVAAYGIFWLGAAIVLGGSQTLHHYSRDERARRALASAQRRQALASARARLEAQANPPQPEPTYWNDPDAWGSGAAVSNWHQDPDAWYESVLSTLSPSIGEDLILHKTDRGPRSQG